MGRVVEVVGDERRGFHKIVPCLAHASKSEEGFDWKAFEDVVNDFLGNKWRLPITYNHWTFHGVTWKGKEQISDLIWSDLREEENRVGGFVGIEMYVCMYFVWFKIDCGIRAEEDCWRNKERLRRRSMIYYILWSILGLRLSFVYFLFSLITCTGTKVAAHRISSHYFCFFFLIISINIAVQISGWNFNNSFFIWCNSIK